MPRFALPCMLAGCAVAIIAACSVGPPGPGIDTRRAMAHVEALAALGPHPGDSPAARLAASYIETELQAINARVERMPVGTVALPATRRRAARTTVTTDPNLLARFGPPGGRALLVMAHYDTVPGSPGGVDNAAAVAVVLELARMLAAAPPKTPVMLAFTANEEIGLVGAEALAGRRGDEVAFAVALDLIGGTGDLSLNGASRLIGRAELGWLASAANRAGVVVRAPLPHRVVSRTWPAFERADHGPFTRHGIPAFHFYHRGQDGESIDLAYHSARDTAARVAPSSLDEIGRLLRALTEAPPPAHDGDGFWLPIAKNVVVPRWAVVALDAVLAALALGLLLALRTTRARRGLGMFAGLGCYAVAIAVTAGFERVAADGHPAPWLHAPGAALLAELAIFAGAFGLATRAARRFAPWIGDLRYLAVAIVLPLSLGLGCLLAGAAELAWLWLIPATCAAAGPRLGRLGILAIAVSLLPGVLVLIPNQLREAAWHAFLPTGIPLAAWIAGFSLPPLATLAWWLRKAPTAGPLGSLVLPLGCGLAMIAGVTLLLQAHPPCSPQQFHDFHLACEVPPKVR